MKNPTGCSYLDHKKRNQSETEICLNCPRFPKECAIRSNDDDLIERRIPPEIKEIALVCSNCGAMETGTLINGRLERMMMWQQRGRKIYHLKNCGEAK